MFAVGSAAAAASVQTNAAAQSPGSAVGELSAVCHQILSSTGNLHKVSDLDGLNF